MKKTKARQCTIVGNQLPLAILLIVFSASAATASTPPGTNQNWTTGHMKFAKDLDYTHTSGLVDVIVQYRSIPGHAYCRALFENGSPRGDGEMEIAQHSRCGISHSGFVSTAA